MEFNEIIKKVKNLDLKNVFLLILSFFLLIFSFLLFSSFVNNLVSFKSQNFYYFHSSFYSNYNYKIEIEGSQKIVEKILNSIKYANISYYSSDYYYFLYINVSKNKEKEVISYLTKNVDGKVIYFNPSNKNYSIILVEIKNDKIFDFDRIKKEWKNALKDLVDTFNKTLIDLTIGFPIFLMKLIKYIVYFYITLIIAIFSLKILKISIKKIWNF